MLTSLASIEVGYFFGTIDLFDPKNGNNKSLSLWIPGKWKNNFWKCFRAKIIFQNIESKEGTGDENFFIKNWQPRPLFVYFRSNPTQSLQKNQRDSNSDRQSRRRPLDHQHGGPLFVFFGSRFTFIKFAEWALTTVIIKTTEPYCSEVSLWPLAFVVNLLRLLRISKLLKTL